MTQQKDVLTIDQKIQIARLATDIYMIEYPSGQSSFLRATSEDRNDKPSTKAEEQMAYLEQKAQDIRNSFQGIYHSIEDAITRDSGNDE